MHVVEYLAHEGKAADAWQELMVIMRMKVADIYADAIIEHLIGSPPKQAI